MSAKPYHAGHDGLVRVAAKENDEVHLYVSLSDRDEVSGKAMEQVWKELITPTLPANVRVEYVVSPVGSVFKELGDANEAGSKDEFNVYSDAEDIKRFSTLPKYAQGLLDNGQIHMRPIERTSTVNVSGTQMRGWLAAGNKQMFAQHLPKGIDADRYWDILQATKPEPKKPAKKKAAPKKPVQGEALLRSYVREILRG